MKKTYPITYLVARHDPPMSRSDVEASEGLGACDALLIASIIRPPDGSLSILFLSKDGVTDQNLTDQEMFKVWTLLTNRLTKNIDGTMLDWQSMLVEAVWGMIREMIGGALRCPPKGRGS